MKRTAHSLIRMVENAVICAAVTAFLLVSASRTRAQPPPSFDFPGLGTASVLETDPSNPAVLYAGFLNSGLFKSLDGGENWFPIVGGLPGERIADLEIDSFNPEVLYLLEADHGIFKSVDGGVNWLVTLSGLGAAPAEIRQIAADPDQAFIVYAATAHGLFRSLDAAASWHLLAPAEQPVERIFFHPTDPDVLYLITAGQLFVSVDRGILWSPLGRLDRAFGGELDTIHEVVIDPARPRVFYAATSSGVAESFDGGLVWKSAGLPLPTRDLLFDPKGALLAATERGIALRLAPGQAWQPLLQGAVRVLGLDPFEPGGLLFGTDEGRLLRRRGESVEQLLSVATPPPAHLGGEPPPPPPSPPRTLLLASDNRRGVPSSDLVHALATDPDTPGTVYAGTRQGVWKSTDFGRSWQRRHRGLELTDVRALAVDPERPEIVYAATHGAGLFKSLDGAGHWRPARRGLDVAVLRAVAVDPLEPSVLYAGGWGGLQVSRDHGGHWARPSHLGDVRALAYSSDPLQLLVGFSTGQVIELDVTAEASPVWHPEDGRPKLKLDPRPSTLERAFDLDPRFLEIRDLAIDPEHPRLVYAATVFGLWKSLDGGRRFRRLELEANLSAVAIDPLRGTTLYAGSERGVLKSLDGGRSWSRIKISGLPRDAAVISLALQAWEPHTVVFAGFDRGVVAASVDSGASWHLGAVHLWAPPEAAPEWIASALPAALDQELADRLEAHLEAIPPSAVRQRIHLALERARRSGRATADETAGDLRRLLAELASLVERHGEEEIQHLAWSADRWLIAEHRFDDGAVSHSELRLYDAEAAPLRESGPRPYDEDLIAHRVSPRSGTIPGPWRALNDPAREPPHLHPDWILPDPGAFLSSSPAGRHIVTRTAHDQLTVWQVGKPRRPMARRRQPTTPRVPTSSPIPLRSLGVDAAAWGGRDRFFAAAGPNLTNAIHRVRRERGEAVGEAAENQERSLVHVVDLERQHGGTLRPRILRLEERRFDRLAFSPDAAWLGIFGEERTWGLLTPRHGRFLLALERRGADWRRSPASRLRTPWEEAPETFAELAASLDAHFLAGVPLAADGSWQPELRLWRLGMDGPEGEPIVLELGPKERDPFFTPDHLCLQLGRGAKIWNLGRLAAAAGWPGEWSDRGAIEDGEEDPCRRRVDVGAGGRLEFPPRDEPRPPPFESGADETLDGWGCRGCSCPECDNGSFIVWRRAGNGAWSKAGVEVPELWRVGMSPNYRWLLAASPRRGSALSAADPQIVQLWDLARKGPAGARLRLGRFGPVGLHLDEGAPEASRQRLENVWREERPLHMLPDSDVFGLACRVLGRNLSEAEWQEYLGRAVPYQPACEFVPVEQGQPERP